MSVFLWLLYNDKAWPLRNDAAHALRVVIWIIREGEETDGAFGTKAVSLALKANPNNKVESEARERGI